MNDEKSPQFSPGQYIELFLQQRGWSQADLAQIMGRPSQVVNEIILGRRGVSPRTARELAAAFGTSVEVWRNVDKASRQGTRERSQEIELRAKIFALGPIKEMVRRRWIAGSKRATELAEQIVAFFGMRDIDDKPIFEFCSNRMSTSYTQLGPAQMAWLHRARWLADQLKPIGAFNAKSLMTAVSRLREVAAAAGGVSQVPEILSGAGIRFVVVEHLPKTRLDGACFWLDDGSPVIAMTMRYERIDYFWHTLFHELGHVSARDGLNNQNGRPDTDLPGTHTPLATDRPESEVKADAFAANALIPEGALAAFIARNRPLYSRRRITDFAEDVGVHPGIVVGQLQYRGEILYSHSRDLLVSVRDIITAAAETDGWTKRSA
jgi:HTH-type transcriptional regulator/antitoxin HigA